MPEETGSSMSQTLGEKGTLNHALQVTLELLGVDQLQTVLGDVKGTLKAIEQVSEEPRSEFVTGMKNECVRLIYRIEQQLEIAQGNETAAKVFRLACARCGFPFTYSDSSTVCINCGHADYIQVDRIEPPPDHSVTC